MKAKKQTPLQLKEAVWVNEEVEAALKDLQKRFGDKLIVGQPPIDITLNKSHRRTYSLLLKIRSK